MSSIYFLFQLDEYIQAWFPYDRSERPDRPRRFKKFWDDQDDWDDCLFPSGLPNRWKSWKSIRTIQVHLIASIFISSKKWTIYELQWKLVNTVTNEPKKKKKSGLINGAAVLPGQAQISWLEGRNQNYTVRRIQRNVLINKQPESRYRIQ